MFFEKNTEQFTARHRLQTEVYKTLLHTAPSMDLELYDTEADDYTIKYKGIFLHDPMGAQIEAEQCVKQYCTPRLEQVHLILGMGLGYMLQAVYSHSPGKIIIYEPDPNLLRFVLNNVDLSEYFDSGRVYLATNLHQLMDVLRPFVIFADKMDVITNKSYAYLMADDMVPLMQKLEMMCKDRLMDFATVNLYHEKWLHQLLGNVSYFPEIGSVNNIAGIFKDKPAVVVSSGPSLDKGIETLKANRDSFVIIAVGGAVRRLHKEGLAPDFSIYYDAAGMQEQINKIPHDFMEKIAFIHSPVTHPSTFETPSRYKFVFASHNNPQFAVWMDELLNRDHIRLEGAGTVSIIGLQLAFEMGCNPIALIGQDLAMPNNQVYAGGVELVVGEDGLMRLPQSDTLNVLPERLVQVKGQNGEDLVSQAAFAGYLRHLEDIADRNKSRANPFQLYNCSLGGAHIEGYELVSMQDFTEKFAPPAWKKGGNALDVTHLKNQQLNYSGNRPTDKLLLKKQKRILEGFADLKKDAQDIIELAKELSTDVMSAMFHFNTKEEKSYGQDFLSNTQLRMDAALTKFESQTQINSMIRFAVVIKALEFQNFYNRQAKDIDSQLKNAHLLVDYLKDCEGILTDVVHWIETAEAKLHDRMSLKLAA